MKPIACLAIAALLPVIGACGTGATLAGAVLQVAGINRQPGAPQVPQASKPPRDVTIRLHAGPALNASDGGPPLALVARIYKLRQADAFERAPYAGFANPAAERELLGPDLLEVKEVLLVPGQRFEVAEKVEREAGYVGVVALFRSPLGQHWRATFAAADAEQAGITLGLHGCSMTVGQGAAARAPAPASASPPTPAFASTSARAATQARCP